MKEDYSNILESKLNGYIYWWNGFLMGLFKTFYAAEHQHYTVEMYVGLDGPFKIDMGDGWNEYRAVIIDSNHPHKIREENGWLALFLMESTVEIVSELQKNIFNRNKYVELDNDIIDPFIKKLHKFKEHTYTCNDIKVILNELISSILNNKEPYLVIEPRVNIDPRIRNILKYFDENIPEKKMSVRELTQLVKLSESRLAHLFKEQMEIPIRRFLLWLRLKEALRLIVNGESFTTAAYKSGFSDLAHLSRTYRKMFGLSLSYVFRLREFVQVVTSLD